VQKLIKFFKKIGPILLILFLGAYCSRGIFTYHFFSTHDGDHHIARSYDAIQTLSEGHFPLRWAGSLNYFCGVPIFNFFYPLLYYLIFLINLLVGDVVLSLKVVYVLSFTLAPLFFYFWLKQEIKNTTASLFGAILYLFVPYRFLLVFVRSSPEFLAYTILPIFLYFLSIFFKKAKNKKRSACFFGFFTSLLGAMFVISHNLVAFLLSPILSLWFIIKVWRMKIYQQKSKLFFLVILTAVSIIGLSAFFWGPVFLERGQTKLGRVETINYWQHFPTLKQLIRSPWGYFYSLPGVEDDGMSFSLGYAQWVIIGLGGINLLFWAMRKKINWCRHGVILFWFFISCFSIFLMLEPSRFIWEAVPLLLQIQFPWRFLGVTSFTIAAMGGFWLVQVKNKKVFWAFLLLISFLAIYGNRNHLLPQPLIEPEKYDDFNVSHQHRYSTTTVGDDILNQVAISACSFNDDFLLINNQVINNQLDRGNTFGNVKFEWPKTEAVDMIKLNLEYFPGIYQININNKQAEKINNLLGRVSLEQINLNEGENIVDWQIVQSPIERRFNAVSLGFLVFWLILIPAYEIKRKI